MNGGKCCSAPPPPKKGRVSWLSAYSLKAGRGKNGGNMYTPMHMHKEGQVWSVSSFLGYVCTHLVICFYSYSHNSVILLRCSTKVLINLDWQKPNCESIWIFVKGCHIFLPVSNTVIVLMESAQTPTVMWLHTTQVMLLKCWWRHRRLVTFHMQIYRRIKPAYNIWG